MNNKTKAWLIIASGVVLWLLNGNLSQGNIENSVLGITGNAIATVLFIWGIVKLVKAYRKKSNIDSI